MGRRELIGPALLAGMFLLMGSEAGAQVTDFTAFPGSYLVGRPMPIQPPVHSLTPYQGARYPLGVWTGYGGRTPAEALGASGYNVLPSYPRSGWSNYSLPSSPRSGWSNSSYSGYNVLPRW